MRRIRTDAHAVVEALHRPSTEKRLQTIQLRTQLLSPVARNTSTNRQDSKRPLVEGKQILILPPVPAAADL